MELKLDIVAATLEGLEDTIVFKLIDRAQFATNEIIYRPGMSGFANEDACSLFQLRLRSQESMDATFGRFMVPEEIPFSVELPAARRSVTLPDTGLDNIAAQSVNLSNPVMQRYLQLVPQMCRQGDDGHYGSSVEHDIYALQALSRRIHFGALYVAECKFRENPEEYARLIAAQDLDGLLQKLTRQEVEERIIARVCDKVAHAQEMANTRVRTLIDPEILLRLYRDTIIPLTKEGEIAYLLQRHRD